MLSDMSLSFGTNFLIKFIHLGEILLHFKLSKFTKIVYYISDFILDVLEAVLQNGNRIQIL